jgi:thymidine phosphorylase
MLIYEERVAAPHIDILLEELLELKVISNRVDHPRKKSKDLADAMCGAAYNAISHTKREKQEQVIEIHTYSSFKLDRQAEEEVEYRQPINEDIKEYLRNFKLI